MAGNSMLLSPDPKPMKELKYRISTKVHQRIFSPELLMNSDPKADEMHVSPTIAKPAVWLYFYSLSMISFFKFQNAVSTFSP